MGINTNTSLSSQRQCRLIKLCKLIHKESDLEILDSGRSIEETSLGISDGQLILMMPYKRIKYLLQSSDLFTWKHLGIHFKEYDAFTHYFYIIWSISLLKEVKLQVCIARPKSWIFEINIKGLTK